MGFSIKLLSESFEADKFSADGPRWEKLRQIDIEQLMHRLALGSDIESRVGPNPSFSSSAFEINSSNF